MVVGLVFVCHHVLVAKTISTVVLFDFLKSNHMTNTEMISYYFTFIPQLIALVGNYLILSKMGPNLQQLIQKIRTFSDIDIDGGMKQPQHGFSHNTLFLFMQTS